MRTDKPSGHAAPITACAMLVALLMTQGTAFAERPRPFDRTALEKWVETRRLISQEKEAWRTSRMVLDDRIELIEKETESVREKTVETRANIGEADTKLAEIEQHNESLKDATVGLRQSVATLEHDVKRLLARAPAPIRERLKPLSQRIPTDPDTTKTGLSERYQNVIGILNELNKFSLEITESIEIRTLVDGTSAEVTVLYLGLGQAYYCNTKGDMAGVGHPGPDGWIWEPANADAEAISHVIAVFRNEKPAVYVSVPANLIHEEN